MAAIGFVLWRSMPFDREGINRITIHVCPFGTLFLVGRSLCLVQLSLVGSSVGPNWPVGRINLAWQKSASKCNVLCLFIFNYTAIDEATLFHDDIIII